MNIFVASHSDDEALFGSYIIQRTHPLVVVCTNGTSHQRKFGIPVEQRQQESRDACKVLGVKVVFLEIAEEELTKERLGEVLFRGINKEFQGIDTDWNLLFAPTKDGGNPHHDLVSDFFSKFAHVLYYGNYSKDRLFPVGELELEPTSEELVVKEKALACYTSQLRVNPHHFEAVKGVSEYLSFKQC